MNKYMKEADNMAKENILTNNGGPFGAVVIRNGEIIGRGQNQVVKNNDPTAHSEIIAIREACKHLNSFSLDDCELYTNCYPCPMCLSAIIWSNIKTVYYGNTKEDADKIGFRDNKIYKYIECLQQDKNDIDTLQLVPMDRYETIKTFEEFDNKIENKTMY